jgi:hypothetical protein
MQHTGHKAFSGEGIQPLRVEVLRRVADGATSLREAARVVAGFDAENVESGVPEE